MLIAKMLQISGKTNSLLPKKSKNTYINLLDRRENKTIKCADTADFINQFFTNIGPQLAKKFTRK